ncbi:MAG: hypothetical protein M3P84_12700, partial [Chloroflexota bacterium]|nr:hypothetical protein [Chloroflexota bacterium]
MSGARTAALPTARRQRPDRRPPSAFALLAATAFAIALSLAPAGPAARPVAAAGGVTLDARGLLAGHGRVGSWMAIAVTVANDGPALTGELRINAGAQGRTRFGLPVDLPTGSRKSLELYAQPPAFGQFIDVSLVTPTGIAATAKVSFSVPDNTQLVVGVLAEKAAPVVAALRLPPSISGTPAIIFPLTVADLPGRVEAWDPIDRLVWQDTDASTLRPDQLAALRGWIAGGGRLTIVGGTSGAGSLAGLPDDLLPYRPRATTDISPQTLQDLVGQITTTVQTIPAMTGDRSSVHGRVLASSGDQVTAAEAVFGGGAVTILGVDPTGDWLARTTASDAVWNRIVPPRSVSSQLVVGDDSQLLNAVNTLPSLALPPIGGLLILLFGYILLVGPINYFVLRRLDRREWAWVTMPLLVVGFAAAAYLYGNTLRGGQVIINSVAIVRGAPDTTVASATAYVGVFSPTRETYQLEIPGGALLSPPVSNAFDMGGFNGAQNAAILDILQGETARVRDLAVGYGSLRAVRAEVPVVGPQVSAVLRLEGDHLKGTVTNRSTITLEKPALVLGGSVAVLADLAPGASVAIALPLGTNVQEQRISDRILGDIFFGGQPFGNTVDDQRLLVRQAILNQLTFDPNSGASTSLSPDGAVLIAFGRGDVVGARLAGAAATSTGDVLYYVPLPIRIQGQVTFSSDLMQGTLVSSDGQMFGKGGGPPMIFFQGGTLTQAYRPPVFEGTLRPSKLILAVNQGTIGAAGAEVDPTGPGDGVLTAAEEDQIQRDGTPFIELFDRQAGKWLRFAHVDGGTSVSIAEPARYVDPTSGTVLVRFRASDQND